VSGLALRALKDSMRSRRYSDAPARPFNSTVRRHVGLVVAAAGIPGAPGIDHRLSIALGGKMRIALVIIALCFVTNASAEPSDDDFSAAWREGQHNEHETIDGAAYIHEMVRWLGPALSDSQRQCGGRPKDMTEPVRLAVQLNLDGSVRKAMISPSTTHWECVKEALAKKAFPAPPRDGFWTSGTIR
jgi:hypothetical protein